jgi:hypothetical protein
MLGGNARIASGSRTTRSSGRNPTITANTRRATPVDEPISPEKQLHNDCVKVLNLMETLGIDLGNFICSIFYGNPESRAPLVTKAARASFIQTDKFSTFLSNVYKPPRPPKGKGTMPTSGRDTLVSFAIALTQGIFKDALAAFSDGYEVDKKTLIDTAIMEDITSDYLGTKMTEKCPRLWETLVGLTGNEVAALEEEDAQEKKASEAQTNGAQANTEGEAQDTALGIGEESIKPHPYFVSILFYFIEHRLSALPGHYHVHRIARVPPQSTQEHASIGSERL